MAHNDVQKYLNEFVEQRQKKCSALYKGDKQLKK